jgi:hypothetical protein
VDVHYYNFAVASTTLSDSEDSDDAYVRTRLYRRSLEFDPDVVVLMLGTNDALRCDSNDFNQGELVASLESLLWSYLVLPAEPDVLVLTPAPVFDSIMVSVTRAATRKRREKAVVRRAGYGFGNATACMMRVVGAIRATVAKMSALYRRRGTFPTTSPQQQRLFLVDMYSMVLDDLTNDAIDDASGKLDEIRQGDNSSAVSNSTRNTTLSTMPSGRLWWSALLSQLYQQLPVVEAFHKSNNSTRHAFLGAFPLASGPGQRAIARAMSDGCHPEKALQKKFAAEVMRHLWLVDHR